MFSNSKSTPLLLAFMLMALASAAEARGGGRGGGDGDFALRAELTNPGYIEPGSSYGYFRSNSRGPAYPHPFPPKAHRYYNGYGNAPYLYNYQGW
jgi:hypothetical protein